MVLGEKHGTNYLPCTLREEDGPGQGTLMGRGWVPASLQETEQRCLQLATFRRRGVGNIPGTVYDADAGA